MPDGQIHHFLTGGRRGDDGDKIRILLRQRLVRPGIELCAAEIQMPPRPAKRIRTDVGCRNRDRETEFFQVRHHVRKPVPPLISKADLDVSQRFPSRCHDSPLSLFW